ncbi:hypothetical protein [Albimonas pacifica]|uniref:DUF2066 domain-containing protein n=1 Tax=Albimonas pacifica TaxID=1114924 RepID=A0A1I3H716_9RHOB|nr:hypothetical protein [Albimonas pacifica]SFI31429.1 hypothetical protein SAMN05216258_105533 [Albimonas pacifica]
MFRAACLLAAGAVWAPVVGSSSAQALDGVTVRAAIHDPAVSSVPVATPEETADPALRAFAAALLADLEQRLAAGKDRPARAEARVARIPLVASGDAPFPALPAPPDAEGADCTVESPWLALAVRRDETGLRLDLRALWSERQALLDLAALDSEAPLPTAAPQEPLTRSEFAAMAEAWRREAMGGEAPPEGAPPLAERLPPDAAWLFAHAPQAGRGPFDLGAEGALRRLVPRLAPDYAALAGALISRCLGGGGEGGRFGGPLDIRALAGPDFGASVRNPD